jgi:hypothetical protein
MKLWSFLDFVDDRGENVIQRWLQSLPPSARKSVKAKMTARIEYLEVTPVFCPPYARDLHGECEGLFEIIFRVKNLQYRPLACRGPDTTREVTLLMGAIEREERFDPPGACSTALRRKALIFADRRYVRPHDFR